MYYLRSRFYSPVINKFICPDRVVKDNLYNYCVNNPVSYSDSEGLYPTYSLEGLTELHNIVALKVSFAVGGTVLRKKTGIPGAGLHGGYGYPDVVDSSNHAWEIKFNNTKYGWTSGHKQIDRYTDGTGYIPGYPVYIKPFDYVLDGVPGIVSVSNGSVETDDAGVVYYEFDPISKRSPVYAYDPVREPAPSYERKKKNVTAWDYVVGVALLAAAIISPIPGDEAIAMASFALLFSR